MNDRDDCEARVVAGRAKWPEMASELDAAHARVCVAIATGDVEGGAAAFADWVDARVALVVYADVWAGDA